MRTIGLIASLLLLSVPAGKSGFLSNDQPGTLTTKAPSIRSPFYIDQNKNKSIDTTALKQSSWYAAAVRGIEESEYEIKPFGETNEFASPNRQQNLRAFFTAAKFILEPRKQDDWELELSVKGIYTGSRRIYSPQQDAIATSNKNKIRFNHNNDFTVEYINSKEGVRQNFIIEKEPVSKPKTISVKLQANKGWLINQVHANEIHFAKAAGERIEKKITYNSLKAWDAGQKKLEASFAVTNNEISITVNTTTAEFPVTIDPLSTTANWTAEGNQASAFFGGSVASAGDVNGDGYSDVIAGAAGYDNPEANEGRAFVFYGSATGLSVTPNWTEESDLANSGFGSSVSSAGDVNGDGYSDVIIGAINYSNGQVFEGAAFIYHGSGSGLSAVPNWTAEGEQASARFGCDVSCAGDVNGDGYSDVIIGAFNFDFGQTDEGRAFVYHGSGTGLPLTPDWTAESDQASAIFGYTVASAGDVNGDGFSDVIIGSHLYDSGNTNEGRAYVYLGSGSGLLLIPNWTAESDQDLAYFGWSVSSAGDVNGDGYSDVIIGSYLFDNGEAEEGRAFVYHGSASGLSPTPAWTTESNQAGAVFGSAVSAAGDVNGDGYSDVIVGSMEFDNGETDEGRAYLFLGSATGLSVVAGWTTESNQLNASLGVSVAPAGDVNGDGYSDIIVGSAEYDNGDTDEGAAYVFHGSPDGLTASPVNIPNDADQADANFGVSVASAGDVNGDGYSDVIIGAWRYDGSDADEGRAFIYHGSATGLGSTYNSFLDDANQVSAFFGEAVAGAGDVNGDGYSDVIIGADNFDAGGNNEGRAFVYHGSAGGIINTPAIMLDVTNQANAYFGVSVAAAGDVNRDGYGDVIVGAIGITDGGNANEGRAYVYHGSAAGLNATPNSTPDDADQAGAMFGWCVGGAGDVNGDGYSDVIIGALFYDDPGNPDEGRVFVYHGSATGLNTTPNNTPDDANQAGAQFGESVAAAGDVNGDGYSDVIIGARLYDDAPNTDEGRAFVYHGSSTGLSASPDAELDDANQTGASFGISVASAGDVNGDGYSDVIIGAIWYDAGSSDEGRAFIYHGSSTGLGAAPAATRDDADETGAYFGYTVACAGDVNGDGYSDVIVGAHFSDDGTSNEGRAFVYYGNNTGGLRNNLRLYNTDLVTPIQRFNIAEGGLFGAGLFSKSALGRVKGKLTWEVIRQGLPFSGNPITNSTSFLGKQSAWTDLGTNGTELKNLVQKPGFQNKIRTRVEYDKATAITGQVYGPWRYPPGYVQGAHGMNSIPLPVRFISFTAVKENEQVRLRWITAGEDIAPRYEVEYSSDGSHFSSLATVQGFGQPHNTYDWLHTRPVNGANYYRVRVVEDQSSKLTETRQVNFSISMKTLVYPQPARAGGYITLLDAGIKKGEQIRVVLLNCMGQQVWETAWAALADGTTRLQVPVLPTGMYQIRMETGGRSAGSKLIISGD